MTHLAHSTYPHVAVLHPNGVGIGRPGFPKRGLIRGKVDLKPKRAPIPYGAFDPGGGSSDLPPRLRACVGL